MNGDYSVTAEFVKQYDLIASGTEGGSVTEPGEGLFTYDEGTVVDLIAEAEEGYRFDEWIGDVGTVVDVYAATTTITMNGDYSVTAEFVKQYDLIASGTEGGSVATPGEGVFTYDVGTVVDLIATPAAGYRFVEWTGDVGTIADVHAATTAITMNGIYSITAEIVRQYDLTISSAAGGTVTTPGVGVFTYDTGTAVNLVASPSEGYYFAYWAGDVGTIAGVHVEITTITMNGDYSITANFVEGSSTPPPWGSSGGCFIATAAYGTPSARQIDVLRDFRDDVLLKNAAGSQFVALYYRLSPPIADFIAGNGFVRTLVRELLIDPIVRIIEATGDMWRN
jgi:hypothetical protein